MSAQEPSDQRRFTVTFVLSSLRLSGGVMVIIEVANRLTERGHTVTLITPANATDSSMLEMLGPQVRVVESKAGRSNNDTQVRTLGALRRLLHLRVALSLARSVPPSEIVVSTHTPTTVPALLAGRRHRARLLWFFMDYAEMFRERPLEGWLMRNALRWHDAAITISRATADELRAYSLGNVTAVGMGLSHTRLLQPVFVEQRPLMQPPILLYVGDDRPRKGLADFLAAAGILADSGRKLTLEIVSRTPIAVETSVPHRLHIAPSPLEVARLMQSCNCYVMTSWSEGLGLPPLEAMACGAPVVLTSAGGPSEYAEDGVNCLVAPPRNPQAIADAVARVLDDADLARRLSHAGPATAARYQWDPVLDRIESVLHAITRGGKTNLLLPA